MSMRTFCAAAGLGLACAAMADVVTLQCNRDNTIYESGPVEEEQTSNGAGAFLFAGQVQPIGGSTVRRGLVRFDPTLLPPTAVINSATLTLHMSKTVSGGQTVTVHKVLDDWGEGTSDGGINEGGGAPSTPGDASWFWRFVGTAAMWASPGGDFEPTASATQTVAGIAFYSWTSAQLKADVDAWRADPSTNFGWLIKGVEGIDGTAKRFDSRQNTNVSFRPVLVIDYTVPQPPVACCLPSGACVEVAEGECGNDPGEYESGTTCSPNPCAVACCFPDGTCQELFINDCLGMAGGVPGASDSTCTPNTCPPPPNGVCCFGAACIENQPQASCVGANRLWVSTTIICNAPGNYKVPCCKADYNKVNGITVQDLFDYLAAWFAKLLSADINGNPPAAGAAVTVQDLFDFLAAWFAKGCP